MDYAKLALERHENARGKIEITSTVPLKDEQDLSTYYTPGVAAPCLAIKEDPALASKYTARDRMVAIVTDGSAILGLGNIGALAGMPVMEGKAVLFKHFAGRRRLPHLPCDPGSGRDHRHSKEYRAGLRRHQSGGYRRACLL